MTIRQSDLLIFVSMGFWIGLFIDKGMPWKLFSVLVVFVIVFFYTLIKLEPGVLIPIGVGISTLIGMDLLDKL